MKYHQSKFIVFTFELKSIFKKLLNLLNISLILLVDYAKQSKDVKVFLQPNEFIITMRLEHLQGFFANIIFKAIYSKSLQFNYPK